MSLPNLTQAMTSWFQDITVNVITKTVVNFSLQEVRNEVTFEGVMQPLSAQDLKILPEAQRSWVWQQLHCEPSLVLNLDDVIEYGGLSYRVMAKKDYLQYGYVEYHLADQGPDA